MSVLLLSCGVPDDIISGARRRGFDVIAMPESPLFDERISSHPDILLFSAFGRLFVRGEDMKNVPFSEAVGDIKRLCPDMQLYLTDDTGGEYPREAAYNCFIFKNALFGLGRAISPDVLAAANRARLDIVSVRQGYAKCSAAIIGGDAVVTSDTSIYNAAAGRGYEAHLISRGHIRLPGYGGGLDGFIGGASFFADGKLYFLGDIDTHPDCDIIKKAAARHGYDVVSLSDCTLFDSGCLYLE